MSNSYFANGLIQSLSDKRRSRRIEREFRRALELSTRSQEVPQTHSPTLKECGSLLDEGAFSGATLTNTDAQQVLDQDIQSGIQEQ